MFKYLQYNSFSMSLKMEEERKGEKDKDLSKNHTIVTEHERIKARKELLTKEK